MERKKSLFVMLTLIGLPVKELTFKIALDYNDYDG